MVSYFSVSEKKNKVTIMQLYTSGNSYYFFPMLVTNLLSAKII